MHNKKIMFCASLLILMSAMTVTGQAADAIADKTTDAQQEKIQTEIQVGSQPENKIDDKTIVKAEPTATKKVENKATNKSKSKKKKKNNEKQSTGISKDVPIVIDAEHISFSDATGDLSANGHVSVVQNENKLLTEALRGNSKKTELWVDDIAEFYQVGMKMTGTNTYYNYTKQTGSMRDAKGISGKQFLAGKNVEMLPGETIIHHGTMTKCPAKVPDYHISADKLEIWPGDKMIAYNAKFWIGKVLLLTLPKYQKALDKDDDEDLFPKVGYRSSDGMYIEQHLEHPFGDNVSAAVDLNYYSKTGFKPHYGLIDREEKYVMSVMQGEYQDSNGYWIKKEPEFKFDLYSQRVGKLPVSYTFSAIYGKWTDTTKTSWHQDYNLYFSHDTIKLNESLFLNLGTGLERIHESFDGSNRNIIKFDTSLTKYWSPKFSTTAEYHYTKNNVALFNYNSADMAREADIGFTYRIDNKNAIGFRQSYDLNNSRIYDTDYTWYRDLHCWQATITYREKRKELNWNISTTRW